MVFSVFDLFYFAVTDCNISVNAYMYNINADIFVCVSITTPGQRGCDTTLCQSRTPEAMNVPISDERYRQSGPRVTNLFVSSHGMVCILYDIVLYIYIYIYIYISIYI